MYFKKVVYLDLIHKSPGGWDLKEPEKLGSAGFAKLELSDGKLHLSVNLRVVQTLLPEGNKQIFLELADGTAYVLGNAEYRKGVLSFVRRGCIGMPVTAEVQEGELPDRESGQGGKNSWKPEQIWGIRIVLTQDYEVRGQLPGVEQTIPVPVPAQAQKPDIQTQIQAAQLPETERKTEPESQSNPKVNPKQQSYLPQSPVADTQAIREPQPQEIEHEITAGKSKWEMLLEQYISVHPFQDERIYLSITPEDFLVLSEGDYRLRSNRFLLHGYYNYKHILLGKMPDSTGKEDYYVGVPGLFYEQEKKMAILFGFEGFESRTSRPTDGTFGYYMKRVNL